MTMRRKAFTLTFSCLMLVFFLLFCKAALGFQPLAREFPLGVGIMGAAFAAVNVVSDVMALLHARSGQPSAVISSVIPGVPIEAQMEAAERVGSQVEVADDRTIGRRGLYYWVWVLALVGLVWLVGFVVGGAVFLGAFLVYEARMKRLTILAVLVGFIALEYAGQRLVSINIPVGYYSYVGHHFNDMLNRIL
jgi:hypothetical protein